MSYTNSISTNIIRDQSKKIDYIPTANGKEIFDRIFLHNYGANKSFNLIGNYGTGKSSFLWAVEQNLNGKANFFTNIIEDENKVFDFEFIKIVGQNESLSLVLSDVLNLKRSASSSDIVNTLEKRRAVAEKNNQGLILVIDEFGKLLEYASKNKATDDIYLLQLISEWANNDETNVFFIITLHQNFSSYGKNLSSQDRLEWEKVKGRFVDLVFNEPVEQLIHFASERLKVFEMPRNLTNRHLSLIELIEESNLVSLKTKVSDDLSEAIYPMDWLSASILVNSLQRYGQNERSLFSFLWDTTRYSIKKFGADFFSVSNVYDYIVNSLPAEIYSQENPHRAQWLTTFRVLEKTELIFDDNFEIVADVVKTISLVNIFSKVGGLFDKEFIVEYFDLTRNVSVKEILDTLEKSGIIRFYKHSNKINFLDGTDIDIDSELLLVTKEINTQFSLSREILSRIDFPILLAKKYSFVSGTNRFFEFRILDALSEVTGAEGPIDGYINLIFNNAKLSEVKKKSKEHEDNLFVIYNNSAKIREEVLTILKFEKLLVKHQQDKNALKLLNDEKEYHLNRLNDLVANQLFNNNQNVWIHRGKVEKVENKHKLYNKLSYICSSILYPETPLFKNELINKEFLSSQINTARKALFRTLLGKEELEDIGFEKGKFPPEKAIYVSLLKDTGIHQENMDIGYYKLDMPSEKSNLYNLWKKSEEFLNSTISNQRNLNDFYHILKEKPFKLKKGFVDFWIPIFLIAKREDYALFHVDGGFMPFLAEDALDLIHKKPNDFFIKSYDVSGLKMNLLESYKELVQIGDSVAGSQTTFLSIFGNFLRFQRGLNDYALKTKNLSAGAIALREAIVNSKDPEDALFNQFPAALGYHSLAIKEDVKVLGSYTKKIQDAIREIRTVYDELLNRIENVIVESFYCNSSNFGDYKSEITGKLDGIEQALLSHKQLVFFKRLTSPLDDRTSWLKSVADVALGKSIASMLDEEEFVLRESMKDLSMGLIKAVDIHKYNNSSSKGKKYAIRFYGENGVPTDESFVLGAVQSEELKETKSQVRLTLKNLNDVERKELLLELLSQEMNIEYEQG
ncbi:AAA family ATPase [Mangrovimonas sp. TPBH4]|uniref:AAA family ATPase n=1 Tax=Mangrovimonas sp. TPBH4 TaxID=1645914 RepID=UPI0006B50B12|nr:AAA family ATPase [Mangrovimonas sp. TPBH4]